MSERIAFPESLPSDLSLGSNRHYTTPETLKYITKLLHNSGTALSLSYFLLLLIIQPLLELQYERRVDFSQHVLHKARNLLTLLIKKNKSLPMVCYKRNGKLYSDAQIQTTGPSNESENNGLITYGNESLDSQSVQQPQQRNLINDKLRLLKSSLVDYNQTVDNVSEIQAMLYQVRKFEGRVGYYSDLKLFKTDKFSNSKAGVLKDEIRVIKGWYLTGQV